MKKTLLATVLICGAATHAFAKPAPDASMAARSTAIQSGKTEKTIQVAFCGWFTMPDVQVKIRHVRGADGKMHIMQLSDWPVGTNEFRCI